MEWEKELSEILELADAKELSSVLVSKFAELAGPNEDGYRHIGMALTRLEEVVSQGREDVNSVLWMSFWLGAAWQKACHDAAEG